ncbi:hypothetical protein CHUAL_001074 [Chamberlinius hualienensis]
MNESKDLVCNNSSKNSRGEITLLRLKVEKLAKITVSLPLFSLLFCFCTAMTFQYKEVNQTVCKVFNIIPSISAITGIAPQCYLWRIGVALHCTPRFLIATVYYHNYIDRLSKVPSSQQQSFLRWISINYWLNFMENVALIGVTYISNRDNYPVHEKLFITFMITSLAYMLVNSIVYRWSRPQLKDRENKSFRWKLNFLFGSMASTAGLLYFFYRHRRFCEEMAFSYFSFCEYCIALCNMAYHMTLVWDFPDDVIIVTSSKLVVKGD